MWPNVNQSGARMNCKGCGINTDHKPKAKRTFCTFDCYRSWRRKQRTIFCQHCETAFLRDSRRRKYCSHKCYTAANHGSIHWHFSGYVTYDGRYARYTAEHPVFPGQYVHDVVWWIANPHGKCERCREPAEVVHHRDLDKLNNELSNLTGLCRSCHGTLHAELRRA